MLGTHVPDLHYGRFEMNKTSFLFGMASQVAVGLVVVSAPTLAQAGVPECGNVRLEEVSSCEVKVSGDCTVGCSELGIYKTACATKLVTQCGETCTLDAEPTCTDSCTTQCSSDCDNGVNVICSHNCFTECTTTRDVECAENADPATCTATWDANCDQECDSQCQVVDGSCYQHCIECCGGSCTANANMTCQVSCVDLEVEECEQEFRANCEASCDIDGALFCDGEYIISGSQLPGCVQALIAAGIGGLEVEGEVTIGPDGIDGDVSSGFCSTSGPSRDAWTVPLVGLAAALAFSLRRRKSRS
jgi:MYXO-CTERM domain-containing protein